MKCVLISDGMIAAVSECAKLPTAPGWKTAWHGETYNIGDPVYLFDDKLRRKAIDSASVYGRANTEKKAADETARKARITADNAAQARKDAEAAVEQLSMQLEKYIEVMDRKAAEEQEALKLAEEAEKNALEKGEAEQAAAQDLIQDAVKEEHLLAEADKKHSSKKTAGKKDK